MGEHTHDEGSEKFGQRRTEYRAQSVVGGMVPMEMELPPRQDTPQPPPPTEADAAGDD